MTLEEFADQEMAQLAAREERAAAAAAGRANGHANEGDGVNGSGGAVSLRYSQLVAEGLEEDTAKVDAATLADRDWDEFRETHKKGSGNKMGKMF